MEFNPQNHPAGAGAAISQVMSQRCRGGTWGRSGLKFTHEEQSQFPSNCGPEGHPKWLSSKESTCSERDSGLIPGLGKSPGEGNGNSLQYS